MGLEGDPPEQPGVQFVIALHPDAQYEQMLAPE